MLFILGRARLSLPLKLEWEHNFLFGLDKSFGELGCVFSMLVPNPGRFQLPLRWRFIHVE
jgi:hypothetical protein